MIASLELKIKSLNKKVEDSDKTFNHIEDELGNMTKTSTELGKRFEDVKAEVDNIIKGAELEISDKISETIHFSFLNEINKIENLSRDFEKIKIDMAKIQNQLSEKNGATTEPDSTDIDDLEVDEESGNNGEESDDDNDNLQNDDQL